MGKGTLKKQLVIQRNMVIHNEMKICSRGKILGKQIGEVFIPTYWFKKGPLWRCDLPL